VSRRSSDAVSAFFAGTWAQREESIELLAISGSDQIFRNIFSRGRDSAGGGAAKSRPAANSASAGIGLMRP